MPVTRAKFVFITADERQYILYFAKRYDPSKYEKEPSGLIEKDGEFFVKEGSPSFFPTIPSMFKWLIYKLHLRKVKANRISNLNELYDSFKDIEKNIFDQFEKEMGDEK